MPYFVRIGNIPSNLSGTGSRGYHLFRRGKEIVATWGPVEVLPGRHFHWCAKTASRKYPQKSVVVAKAEMTEMIRKREKLERYSRLPAGQRIHAMRKKARMK